MIRKFFDCASRISSFGLVLTMVVILHTILAHPTVASDSALYMPDSHTVSNNGSAGPNGCRPLPDEDDGPTGGLGGICWRHP